MIVVTTIGLLKKKNCFEPFFSILYFLNIDFDKNVLKYRIGNPVWV